MNNNDFQTHMIKGIDTYALFALRLVAIVQAGAIITMLSFISHNWESIKPVIGWFGDGIEKFTLGLTFVMAASACGYFSYLLQQWEYSLKVWAYAFVVITGATFGILSITLFAIGAHDIVSAFEKLSACQV